MRGLMIAAMAVAGLTLGGQAGAQEMNTSQGDTGAAMGMRSPHQLQSDFADDVRQVPIALPAPRFDPRAQEEGTGGSGSLRSETMEIKGVIRSVSDKGMTLTVPKDNRIVTLYADDQVQLMRDNAPLALSSLKLGEEVRASYQFNEDGQKVLRGLEVLPESKGVHPKHKK